MKTNSPLPTAGLQDAPGLPGSLRIYLVRHGETTWSLSGQYTGRTDIPLTACGEDEARALGARIRDISFNRVLTSPLQRARQTCALARLTTPAEVEPDLTEWDHGDDEGRFPADVLKAQPGWNLFEDGAPHGETLGQIGERADRLLARLRMMEGNVALFSHSHFGRVLGARWIGLTVEQAQHFLLDPASLSVLSYDHDRTDAPAIDLWNSATVTPPVGDPAPMKVPAIDRRANEGRKQPAAQKIRADLWGHPQPTSISH